MFFTSFLVAVDFGYNTWIESTHIPLWYGVYQLFTDIIYFINVTVVVQQCTTVYSSVQQCTMSISKTTFMNENIERFLKGHFLKFDTIVLAKLKLIIHKHRNCQIIYTNKQSISWFFDCSFFFVLENLNFRSVFVINLKIQNCKIKIFYRIL